MERLPGGLNVQVPDEGGRATMLTYLITNALKHAFTGRKRGTIVVGFKAETATTLLTICQVPSGVSNPGIAVATE